MSRDDAIRQIVQDHLNLTGISLSEFARRCKTSKAFISKIINRKLGKYGISTSYLGLLAEGMNMTEVEMQTKISAYQSSNQDDIKPISKNDIILNEVKKKLEEFNESDCKLLQDILLNIKSSQLKTINDLIKRMN